MPDLWDSNPDHVFGTAGDQPDPAPNGQDDQTNEVKLRDPSGRLRLPAYILIALVIAAAAILLVAAGLLLAPS
jgi:hypothetical protein